MTTAEKRKRSIFRWGRHWISLLLCVAFRWVTSQFCEQTLDFSSVSSSIYCKMLMASSFHTLTWLRAQSCTAYIVIHTVLHGRTSPLTPQAAGGWKNLLSKSQNMLVLFISKHPTIQLLASYCVYFKSSELMDTTGLQNPALWMFSFMLCYKPL